MGLIKGIEILGLSEKEEKRAIEKHSATLGLISDAELEENIEFLKSKGIVISKACDIPVLANSKSELQKCFDILEEIHHEGIYRQEPNMLNRNVIDLNRMIKYYDQNGIKYYTEGEGYDLKMFTEEAWKNISMKEKEEIKAEEDMVTLEPEMKNIIPEVAEEPKESELVSFKDFDEKEEETPLFQKPEEDEVIDFDSLSMYEEPKKEVKAEEELKELDEQATNFADIRAELENQLKELDGLKNSQEEDIKFDDNLSDIIGFNDIEPESYGMGGR